ncbi:MAG: hypothetical protein GY822_11515 [Deltaproteobacteria bacterium]|nr:hypothetical protein [Deltaproteobacteria bacterium]
MHNDETRIFFTTDPKLARCHWGFSAAFRSRLHDCIEGSGDVPNDAGEVGEFVCEAHALDCASELVTKLSLTSTTVATQSIVNNVDNEVFLSEVDVRAGGVAADPRQPFLYARFEADGLKVVALSDDEALDSDEWDIAFHRYIVRLNGGLLVQAAYKWLRLLSPLTTSRRLPMVPHGLSTSNLPTSVYFELSLKLGIQPTSATMVWR